MSWSMSGQMQDLKGVRAHGNHISLGKSVIGGGGLLNLEPESSRSDHCVVVEGAIKRVQPDRDAPFAHNVRHGTDVIEVRVREPDAFEICSLTINDGEELLTLVARIDQY